MDEPTEEALAAVRWLMDHVREGTFTLTALEHRAHVHGVDAVRHPQFGNLPSYMQWALLLEWYLTVLAERRGLDFNCDLRPSIREVASAAHAELSQAATA